LLSISIYPNQIKSIGKNVQIGYNTKRPLRITSFHPQLALCTRFDAVIAPPLGLNSGFSRPFLAEMPDFGRTSPFRLAPVEQLSSN
jgi:hypothetical protein